MNQAKVKVSSRNFCRLLPVIMSASFQEISRCRHTINNTELYNGERIKLLQLLQIRQLDLKIKINTITQ